MGTYVASDDLLKTCPYDSNHRVAPKKFSTHVAECAKKSTKKLRMCPFDSCHRIAPEEFDAHLVNCESSDPEALAKYKRDQEEWDSIPDVVDNSKAQVAELAHHVQRLNVSGLSRSSDWESDWDTKPKHYVIPGLEGTCEEVTPGQGQNIFHLQNMKPAQKKKYQQKLVEETLQRKKEKEMAPILEAAAEKERLEREKLEKAKKEEQERFEAMRQERERAKKNREAAAKAKKEKKKAAARAAFLAKQAEEKLNGNKENEGQEPEDDVE